MFYFCRISVISFSGLTLHSASEHTQDVIWAYVANKRELEMDKEILGVKLWFSEEREMQIWAMLVVLWIYVLRYEVVFERSREVCAFLNSGNARLKKRIKQLEGEVQKSRGRERKMMLVLICSWVLFIALYVGCN